uniref:DNA-directed RNA polymerase subunit gamma n=2 Tax=Scytosiphon TaxID=27966 RepID=A0A6B7IL54_9PHAE|nr:DNA-directed RNA polymerase subunit beta' [Scytosiphon promiscuus]YP_010147458.1 RNA polymerase beta' subunit [Scytosiphon lomentaria]QDM58360.1 DNA-directed RNA polymerase subunit beta' [Scytosiphon promiscuus]QDM58503.1 DNA-directed RNA polymerase subunit beta' [Scytosiphon promiscuus]QQP22287.1 RNA polymerase beta' subunit [Scytosiphon lomentaria]WAM64598.1 RNA polymerase beta' subunit [Scytosiphon lomentaria]
MKHLKQKFDYVKINLAAPERIKEWAEKILPNGEIVGEVTQPETINYRTHKPEKGGLFCEKIFGPVKNWECTCGLHKYKEKDVFFCEVCGVELTESRVRRHRMGYIKLLSPVVHIWYLKGSPSLLSAMLASPITKLEAVIYNGKKPDQDEDLAKYEQVFLSSFYDTEGEGFHYGKKRQGAEILYHRLKKIDLKAEIDNNRNIMFFSEVKKKVEVAIKKIRIFENFLTTGTRPEWMVLHFLPVLPPGIRPIVKLDNGRFATSDLNELYRKIIIRNKRLKRLLSVHAPSVVVLTEKRMIQEAVDTLIDNGKRGSKILDANKRPLKSLADIIEGKQGRFRQNLLGKRVDYSGRSVIIVGPHLKLNQCGLPYEMAIELFLPFIIYRLLSQGLSHSIKRAKKIIYSNEPFIWYLTEEILKKHPIILNRAPTLHRLGVQAFDPVLVRGRAIQLHPLVCSSFNADFDGDQMAVHIPLSFESQLETRLCLLAPNNFLSASSGEPTIQPSQDMVLGFYYLTTQNRKDLLGSNNYFSNFNEVISAYEQKQLQIHSSIWVRCPNNITLDSPLKFIKTIHLSNNTNLVIYNNLQRKETMDGKLLVQFIRTTPGRIIFNQCINDILNKPEVR